MTFLLGTPVKVLVRRKDAVEYLSKIPGVSVSLGDALDEAAVQSCMEGKWQIFIYFHISAILRIEINKYAFLGCIAAITTLGGQPSEGTGQRVDYAGNSNVIEQAGILGVERIILVTSVGCGSTVGAIPSHVYQTLEGALTAKSKAERDLKLYTNLVILRIDVVRQYIAQLCIFTRDRIGLSFDLGELRPPQALAKPY